MQLIFFTAINYFNCN